MRTSVLPAGPGARLENPVAGAKPGLCKYQKIHHAFHLVCHEVKANNVGFEQLDGVSGLKSRTISQFAVSHRVTNVRRYCATTCGWRKRCNAAGHILFGSGHRMRPMPLAGLGLFHGCDSSRFRQVGHLLVANASDRLTGRALFNEQDPARRRVLRRRGTPLVNARPP